MFTRKNILSFILLILATFVLTSCYLQQPVPVNIIDVKIASGIDDKLMPLGITNSFPTGTQRVFCWFQWKNTKINSTVMASWYFVTDNIHILDYNFAIPRKDGSGSVSLTMPEDKKLPAGLYKVDFNFGKQTLKSTTFKVQ